MDKSKVTKMLILIVFGLVVVYIVAVLVVPRIMVTMTKAAPATKVLIQNSYFLGEKILAKADGKDSCIVNVFAMDKTGKGVIGKSVNVSGVGEPLTGITDSGGKATFEVVSTTEGQFVLEASIDGVALPRNVKVTFRN